MICAAVSYWSCFCWLYRASPSLAAENIINLILVLTIWWCQYHYVLNKSKSKLQWGYHLKAVRVAIIKKSTNNKYWKGCEENRILLHCQWEYKLAQSLWRTSWWFLQTLKIELPYDPATSVLGIYREKHTYKRHMYSKVHYSTIYNRQDMMAAYMPTERGTDKEDVIRTCNGILLSHKRIKWCHLQQPRWT